MIPSHSHVSNTMIIIFVVIPYTINGNIAITTDLQFIINASNGCDWEIRRPQVPLTVLTCDSGFIHTTCPCDWLGLISSFVSGVYSS